MSANQVYLIIARSSPYGSHLPRACADLALTAAAFEQEVTVVFMDDGVLQLLPDQDTQASGMKNLGKILGAFSLYEVNKVYVHSASASQHGLISAHYLNEAEPVNDKQVKALIADADHVMVF